MNSGSPGKPGSRARAESEGRPERRSRRTPAKPPACADSHTSNGCTGAEGAAGSSPLSGEQSTQATPLPHALLGGSRSPEAGFQGRPCSTASGGSMVGGSPAAAAASSLMPAAGQVPGTAMPVLSTKLCGGPQMHAPQPQTSWRLPHALMPPSQLTASGSAPGACAPSPFQLQQAEAAEAYPQRRQASLGSDALPQPCLHNWGSESLSSPGVQPQPSQPAAAAAAAPPAQPLHPQLLQPLPAAVLQPPQAHCAIAAAGQHEAPPAGDELDMLLEMDPDELAEAMLGEAAGGGGVG